MKDSQRKDIESSFLTVDRTTSNKPHSSRRIYNGFPGQTICDNLGGEWTPTSKGAELRLNLDNVKATATISKNRATHLYEYGLRLDSFLVGKGNPSTDIDECLNSLSREIRSVIDVCSELSAKLSTTDTKDGAQD